MGTSRLFSRYTEGQIPGAEQFGNLQVGGANTEYGFGEVKWWNGPDEDLGYVIAHETAAGTQPNQSGIPAYVGFWRSASNEADFVELANLVAAGSAVFTTGDEAKIWLNANGYWTSWGLGTISYVTGLQTYSILCTATNDPTQYVIAIMDFTNNTLAIKPLNLSTNDWSSVEGLPTNESGYLRAFQNITSGDRKILFMDAAGNVIQTLDIPSANIPNGNINYNAFSGKIITVAYGGMIHYFDGLNVYQYVYDNTNISYIDIQSNNSAVSTDGTFIVKFVYTDGNVIVKKIKSGNAVTIREYNTAVDEYDIKLYDQADYYLIFKKHPTTYVFQSFEIRKISDNTLLHEISLNTFLKEDLTPMEYSSSEFAFYGNGKFASVFYNWDDTAADQRIYVYDGVTDTMNYTSHVRGIYNNINMFYDDNSYPEMYDRESLIIAFHTGNQWNPTLNMNTYAYLDLVYKMEWETSLSTYTVTNSGNYDVSFGLYEGRLTNNFHTICSIDGINMQVFSITEADGLQLTTIGLATDFYSSTIDAFGNHAVFRANTANDGTGMVLKYFGETGTVLDTLVATGTSQWSISTFTERNTYGVLHENILYYINTNTNEILTIGPWTANASDSASNYYTTPPAVMYMGSEILLFDSNTLNAVILKPSTYVTGTFPAFLDNWNVRVGKDGIMIVFNEPETGIIKIHLYDFNFNLLNSITTDKTDFNINTRGIKDRFVIRHADYDLEVFTFYMITPTNSNSFVTSTSNVDRLENDWIYWY